jgi:hypothetical protein
VAVENLSTFSLEPLFAQVVAKYPGLEGRFPEWFTGNYSTGVFIPVLPYFKRDQSTDD